MGNDHKPSFNMTQAWSVKNILYLFMFLMFVVVIFLIVTHFAFKKQGLISNKTGKFVYFNAYKNNVSINLTKLTTCLNKKTFDPTCNKIFIDAPLTQVICDKLTGLTKDKCIYEVAVLNYRVNLCDKIYSMTIKSDCYVRTANKINPNLITNE